MQQKLTGFIGFLLLWATAAWLAAPALAANECRIKYSYFKGSGFNRKDYTATAYINLGATRTFNRTNMNYVKNLRTPKVKFYLGGASNVTLGKDQVNPNAGPYLTPVKLIKAKCLGNGSAGTTPSTPALLVSTMKAAGASVESIAANLKSTFNLGMTQVSQTLKAAGYSLNQVAKALKSAFNATAVQVAAALKAAYNASRNQIAVALKGAGYAANQAAAALKSAFNATVSQVAQALKAAGYSLNQVAKALKSAFNATAVQVAAALKAAYNASRNQIAVALKGAGYAANQAAAALKSAFNATVSQVAQALKAAGYTLEQIASALKIVYGLARAQAEQILKNAGYGARQVAAVLNGLYGQAQQGVANTMKLTHAFHGTYAYGLAASQCYWPSGYQLFGAPGYPPLPLPNTGRSVVITLLGANLFTASSISGMPRGASARITGKGNCGIQLEIRVPRNVARSTRGNASLMIGRKRGATFAWVVGPLPPRRTSSAGARVPGRTAAASRNAPDLEPARLDNNLYKVGTGYVEDDQGNMYTALNPLKNSAFCQGVPQAQSVQPDGTLPRASRRIITVPDITWGVKNVSPIDVTGAFTIELRHGNTVVAQRSVASLAAGRQVTFTYRRPNSSTCVARVGVESDTCYHCGNAREGWNDNLGYKVVVDSGEDIRESNERNNARDL